MIDFKRPGTWVRVSMLGTKDRVFMSDTQARHHLLSLLRLHGSSGHVTITEGRQITAHAAPGDDIQLVHCAVQLGEWSTDAHDPTGQRIEGKIAWYVVIE